MEEKQRVYFRYCDATNGAVYLFISFIIAGMSALFALNHETRPMLLIMIPLLLLLICEAFLLMASVELDEDGLHRCVAGFLHEYLRWDEIAVCGAMPKTADGKESLLLLSRKPRSDAACRSLCWNGSGFSLYWMTVRGKTEEMAEKLAVVEQLRTQSGGEFLFFDHRADRRPTMKKLQAKTVRQSKTQDKYMMPTLHRCALVLIATDVVSLLFILVGGFRHDACLIAFAACLGVLCVVGFLTGSVLAGFVPCIAVPVCLLSAILPPWAVFALCCLCAVLLLPALRYSAWASRCYLLQENGIDMWSRQNRQTVAWDEIDSVDLIHVRSAFLSQPWTEDPDQLTNMVLRCTTRAYTGKRTRRQKLRYYRKFPNEVFLLEANAESLRCFEAHCPLPIRDCLQETAHW